MSAAAAHSDKRENPITEVDGLVELEPEVLPDRPHVPNAVDQASLAVALLRLYPASGVVHLNFRVDELDNRRDVSVFERLVGLANQAEVAHALGSSAR